MSEEKKAVEQSEDVKTQYCNSDHCKYDCTTSKPNVCNPSFMYDL